MTDETPAKVLTGNDPFDKIGFKWVEAEDVWMA